MSKCTVYLRSRSPGIHVNEAVVVTPKRNINLLIYPPVSFFGKSSCSLHLYVAVLCKTKLSVVESGREGKRSDRFQCFPVLNHVLPQVCHARSIFNSNVQTACRLVCQEAYGVRNVLGRVVCTRSLQHFMVILPSAISTRPGCTSRSRSLRVARS